MLKHGVKFHSKKKPDIKSGNNQPSAYEHKASRNQPLWFNNEFL